MTTDLQQIARALLVTWFVLRLLVCMLAIAVLRGERDAVVDDRMTALWVLIESFAVLMLLAAAGVAR